MLVITMDRASTVLHHTTYSSGFGVYQGGMKLLVEANNMASSDNSWNARADDVCLALKAACKEGRHCGDLSPSHSWELPALPADLEPPASERLSPSASLHSTQSDLEAKDIAPLSWASVSVQALPPLIDIPSLAPPSQPAAHWDGDIDMLLGGTSPATASAQGDAAAYRSACQQLAWGCGRPLTWAAALAGVQHQEQQQQQQQESTAVAAAFLVLDDKWDYTFTCLEAAAKLGRRFTYAMAAAGVC